MKANQSSARHPAPKSARQMSQDTPVKSPCAITKPVSERYRHHQRPSANRIRLWAIVRLFRLSPSDIAQATGFSRPYVARLLSLNDRFAGSPQFFRVLEAKLGTIIEGRSSQYFTCTAVSVRRVQKVMEQLPIEPVVEAELEQAA